MNYPVWQLDAFGGGLLVVSLKNLVAASQVGTKK